MLNLTTCDLARPGVPWKEGTVQVGDPKQTTFLEEMAHDDDEEGCGGELKTDEILYHRQRNITHIVA